MKEEKALAVKREAFARGTTFSRFTFHASLPHFRASRVSSELGLGMFQKEFDLSYYEIEGIER